MPHESSPMRFLQLRRYRQRRGWTVLALAQAVGVAPVTVRLWERGLATPLPHHQGTLRDLFGKPWTVLAREDRRHGR